MAADFRLIAHSAQRDAHEFAARGAADGHGQGSFAHARRSHQAKDRAARILHQLPHGQVFEDALFDLFEAKVFLFEDLFGHRDVANLLGLLLPRHRQEPVEIVAADGGFGRHRRHQLEALELLHGLFLNFLGHAGGFDLFLQLVEFVLFAAAEFLVNGLELFVQVVLFLRPLHLPLDARIDVAVHVELFDLALEDLGHAVQAVEHIEVFQQFLLFLDRNLQIGGDGVGKLAGIFNASRGNHGVVVQALGQLHVLLEEPVHALDRCLDLRRWFGAHRHQLDIRPVEAFVAGDLRHACALHSFDQHANVAVGQLDALHDVRQRAHRENLVRLRIVHGSIVLRDQENLLLAGQRLFERAHGGFPSRR